MVTIKDIAKVLGVSTSTVSKALNGYGEISKERSELIRATAREMGYHPNAAAQSLKTNRTHCLGVLFVDDTHSGLTHEYFSVVLNSFKESAEHLGYDITFISRNIGETPLTYLEHCRRRNLDGVVIASIDFSDPEVVELMRSEFPAVTIDYCFNNHSAIVSDNVNGMHDLVQYIYSKGHRKIAFIHGEETAVTQNRLASFHRACAELELTIPDSYLVEARYHDTVASAKATDILLALEDRPTCIIYPDDYSYLGGVAELERNGLRIPEDISTAGYDGIPLSQVLHPTLTTVRQDADMIGRKAAELLVEAVEKPKLFIPQTISIPSEVVAGDSVRDLT